MLLRVYSGSACISFMLENFSLLTKSNLMHIVLQSEDDLR